MCIRDRVHAHRLNRRDSVLTNAQTLAKFGGGGTDCGLPLAALNQRKATGDLVIYVSDNESWADPQRGRGTETMRQWEAFRQRNPQARLVCIDIQPYGTAQALSLIHISHENCASRSNIPAWPRRWIAIWTRSACC